MSGAHQLTSNGDEPRSLSSEPSEAMILRMLAGVFQSRAELGRKAGIYKGARDFDVALGYPEDLKIEHYRREYERGGVAQTIVDIYPEDAWSGDIIVEDDEDPNNVTEFQSSFESLSSRLNIFSKLHRAAILTRLGEYGVLLIGAPGTLDEPLERASAEDIKYLTAIPQDKAEILECNDDEESERFLLPEIYKVKLEARASTSKATKTITKKVHHSRIIHLVEYPLEDDLFGRPALRALFRNLVDLIKIIGGGAEAAWNLADPGTHVKIDPKVKFTPEKKRDLREQVEKFRHKLERMTMTQGVDLERLTSSVHGFNSNAEAIERHIAGVSRIPRRKLFGSERGELASTQDLRNWEGQVNRYRGRVSEPHYLRPLVDRFIEIGALPSPIDNTYSVTWPTVSDIGEEHKAELVQSLTQANSSQVSTGDSIIVTSSELRQILGYEPLQEISPLPNPEDEEDPTGLSGAALLEDFKLTDDPLDEPEWKAIHRAADSHIEPIGRFIAQAWSEGSEFLSLSRLEDGIDRRDTGFIYRVLEEAVDASMNSISGSLPDRLLRVLNDGALAALRSARARGSFFRNGPHQLPDSLRSLSVSMAFDETNERSIRFAKEQSSRLITEIGPVTRIAMQRLVTEGIESGIPPRRLAREIKRRLGLRIDQNQAISRLRLELANSKPGTLVERFPPRAGVRTQAGFRAKVPSNITEDWLERQVNRYTRMQHNYRGFVVARSETLESANRGQVELWKQAQSQDQLPEDQLRVLLVTPDERARHEHSSVAGQVARIDEPFVDGDGVSFEPGGPVNCRCGQGLATPEDIERWEQRRTS